MGSRHALSGAAPSAPDDRIGSIRSPRSLIASSSAFFEPVGPRLVVAVDALDQLGTDLAERPLAERLGHIVVEAVVFVAGWALPLQAVTNDDAAIRVGEHLLSVGRIVTFRPLSGSTRMVLTPLASSDQRRPDPVARADIAALGVLLPDGVFTPDAAPRMDQQVHVITFGLNLKDHRRVRSGALIVQVNIRIRRMGKPCLPTCCHTGARSDRPSVSNSASMSPQVSKASALSSMRFSAISDLMRSATAALLTPSR